MTSIVIKCVILSLVYDFVSSLGECDNGGSENCLFHPNVCKADRSTCQFRYDGDDLYPGRGEVDFVLLPPNSKFVNSREAIYSIIRRIDNDEWPVPDCCQLNVSNGDVCKLPPKSHLDEVFIALSWNHWGGGYCEYLIEGTPSSYDFCKREHELGCFLLIDGELVFREHKEATRNVEANITACFLAVSKEFIPPDKKVNENSGIIYSAMGGNVQNNFVTLEGTNMTFGCTQETGSFMKLRDNAKKYRDENVGDYVCFALAVVGYSLLDGTKSLSCIKYPPSPSPVRLEIILGVTFGLVFLLVIAIALVYVYKKHFLRYKKEMNNLPKTVIQEKDDIVSWSSSQAPNPKEHAEVPDELILQDYEKQVDAVEVEVHIYPEVKETDKANDIESKDNGEVEAKANDDSGFFQNDSAYEKPVSACEVRLGSAVEEKVPSYPVTDGYQTKSCDLYSDKGFSTDADDSGGEIACVLPIEDTNLGHTCDAKRLDVEADTCAMKCMRDVCADTPGYVAKSPISKNDVGFETLELVDGYMSK